MTPIFDRCIEAIKAGQDRIDVTDTELLNLRSYAYWSKHTQEADDYVALHLPPELWGKGLHLIADAGVSYIEFEARPQPA